MKFDKSKVYTPFNCDEVKIGSKGIVADNKATLIKFVTKSDWQDLSELKDVDTSINGNLPFYVVKDGNTLFYQYFYLVEEPKEKTKRPCTREELIEMLKKQGLSLLKEKNAKDNYTVDIRSFTDTEITLENGCCFEGYEGLCETYTLLDGTELWVEE